VRCIAVHDDEGNIVSLVVGPDEGPRLMPGPLPGFSAREVALPDEVLSRLADASEAQVSELLGQWRVDVDRSSARVVRREQSADLD
jgi:hypothetical protein